MMADGMMFGTPGQWRSRGYLPHWEAGETAQMIGFRLADSLPAALLERWQVELDQLPEGDATLQRRKRIEAALDAGHGEAWLGDGQVAETVERARLHFDGERYRLHSWVVMPSHGRFVGASSQPFTEYKRRPGERIGHNWRIPNVHGKRAVRHVLFDTNYWKSFIHSRLVVAMGDKGCLSLFGDSPDPHRLLAGKVSVPYLRAWV